MLYYVLSPWSVLTNCLSQYDCLPDRILSRFVGVFKVCIFALLFLFFVLFCLFVCFLLLLLFLFVCLFCFVFVLFFFWGGGGGGGIHTTGAWVCVMLHVWPASPTVFHGKSISIRYYLQTPPPHLFMFVRCLVALIFSKTEHHMML